MVWDGWMCWDGLNHQPDYRIQSEMIWFCYVLFPWVCVVAMFCLIVLLTAPGERGDLGGCRRESRFSLLDGALKQLQMIWTCMTMILSEHVQCRSSFGRWMTLPDLYQPPTLSHCQSQAPWAEKSRGSIAKISRCFFWKIKVYIPNTYICIYI